MPTISLAKKIGNELIFDWSENLVSIRFNVSVSNSVDQQLS